MLVRGSNLSLCARFFAEFDHTLSFDAYPMSLHANPVVGAIASTT